MKRRIPCNFTPFEIKIVEKLGLGGLEIEILKNSHLQKYFY